MTDPTRNPYAPPQSPDSGATSAAAVPGVALGMRVAGLLLILNGALAGLEFLDARGQNILPIIIDILIGISLLQGKVRWRTLAIVRVALGAAIFTAIHLIGADYVLAVLQLVVSGSLLLVLVGEAKKVRIAVACSLFGVYALLEVVGLLLLRR
jgi:hypothetical protein